MALLLGIDTGGTFTDAAILERSADGRDHTVVAKAKSLTTRDDLSIGIGNATEAVITQSECDPRDFSLVSLSTTLATNALVEDQGGRVALIAIGFKEQDLKNAGLAEALGQDPVVMLEGGHTTHGAQANPLDLTPLENQIDELTQTASGFAIAGYFAVRNPAHELAVRDFILDRTGKAVTCSHELSANLNGPKRALTTVLNARLVPLITRLIAATRIILEAKDIKAPVMVVRGDGALVSADFAARRPIETILSGPAASLVGAQFLTGAKEAYVNDIGGTTSDIALLESGKPRLDPDGALVGGFRTMVEAVAMHTFGLGGDSEVGIGGNGLNPELTLGPQRLVPISLIASEHGPIVHTALDAQLKNTIIGRHDGRFAFRSGTGIETGLSANEAAVFNCLTRVPQPIEGLLHGNAQTAALNSLVKRGLVQLAGLTPSDAMHAAGHHDIWDKEAAVKALKLFSRRRDGAGKPIYDDPLKLAEHIIARVQFRSAEVVLSTALTIDGEEGSVMINHPLIQQMLQKQSDDKTVKFSLGLDRPLIGLGASAHAYHPQAAELLNTEALVPEHADVANAIGAVVGQISVRAQATISQPAEGRYQVSGFDTPFASEAEALEAGESHVRTEVADLAREAGAGEIEISISYDIKRATIENRDMFVEGTITAVATGRPPIAD